ncbi:PQ loop repeat-domain-containing protein [Dichotomocladium elegans]|nr:PQ loop repeat-domain-containing protein [Dichotomocladium elegans]
MGERYIAEQVFGYLGLVLWSFQLVPQVIKSYRRKSTDGVSPWTMLIWAMSGALLGNYNIGIQVAVPLIVQPQLFTFIAHICLVQELHYSHRWSLWKASLAFVLLCIFTAGLEIGLVFAFWAAEKRHLDRAIEFFGVLPVVTIIVGFLPQYIHIFRERRVEGVSHGFLFMDFFGSVFSSISLAFRSEIDALTIVNYTSIAILDIGIVLLYYFFEYLHRKKQLIKRDPEVAGEDTDSSTSPNSLVVVGGEKPHPTPEK